MTASESAHLSKHPAGSNTSQLSELFVLSIYNYQLENRQCPDGQMLAPSAARCTISTAPGVQPDRGSGLEGIAAPDAVQDLRREEGNRGDVLGLITTDE